MAEKEAVYLRDGEQEKIVETFLIDIEPMGAVRTTAKGKFTDRAKKYHAWMKSVQWLWKAALMKAGHDSAMYIGNEIIKIEFGLSIPNPETKSLTKVEKMHREALVGKPHMQKPDWDNLCKAFIDAVCYGGDDSHIHTVGGIKKVWAPYQKGYIKITCTLTV